MGTRRTPHPAIADPTEDNIVDVVKAIKESLEIGRTDRRGDPMDNWVTYRDIVDGGIANLSVEGDTTNIYGGVGPLLLNPTDPIVGPPPFDGPFLTPKDPTLIRPLPGRPTNVRTMAVWDGIMVKWDWPPDDGNIDWLGAIVWVSSTPVFSQGTIGGYSTNNFWIHEGVGLQGDDFGGYAVGVRYYWVAWFGRSHDDSPETQWTPVTGIKNQTDWTPHSYQEGVRGATSIDPEYVLNILTGQVTESQIYDSLNTRINLIDYASDGTRYWTPVQDRILAATESVESGVYAAIAQYAGVDVTEDEIRGEYNVRLDLNGYVVGFGLSALAKINSATGEPYGETSAFVIKADTFAVVMPGVDPEIPFIVGRVNGVSTVGINGQLVVDGTITADSIQAESIGADQINASSVWAGIVNANRIFGSTFATGPSPQTRLEINGHGTENEQFPLWYGWGQTSGVSREDISEPYFWADSYGTLSLAGDLYVTGTGRFWLGSNESGDYRLEIGGYEDNILMWAGRTPYPNRSIDPKSDDWIFYIDKFGDAKFRGTVEAKYVSGEFTQVVSIQEWPEHTITKSATGTINQDYEPHWPDEYEIIAEWVLPASPFSNQDVDLQPGHVPWLQLQFLMYGDGVDAGTVAIEWDSGNGIWVRLANSAFNSDTYGGYHQIFAVAPSRIYSACRFRMWGGGRQNDKPTFNGLVGLLMGIR